MNDHEFDALERVFVETVRVNPEQCFFETAGVRHPIEARVLGVLLLADELFVMGDRFELACSDTFLYAYGDSETIELTDLADVFDAWCKGPFGTMAWVVERRKLRPIPPRVEQLKTAGLWKPEYDLYPSYGVGS